VKRRVGKDSRILTPINLTKVDKEFHTLIFHIKKTRARPQSRHVRALSMHQQIVTSRVSEEARQLSQQPPKRRRSSRWKETRDDECENIDVFPQQQL